MEGGFKNRGGWNFQRQNINILSPSRWGDEPVFRRALSVLDSLFEVQWHTGKLKQKHHNHRILLRQTSKLTVAGAIQAERVSMPPASHPSLHAQWSHCAAPSLEMGKFLSTKRFRFSNIFATHWRCIWTDSESGASFIETKILATECCFTQVAQ